MNRQIEIDGAKFTCEEVDGKLWLTGYEGRMSEVFVPRQIDGMPVTAIDKKVFFNQKDLKKVHIPDSIEAIGDWAFAHCDQLVEVHLPQKEMEIGKTILSSCPQLERVILGERQDFAPLLAACAGVLDAPFLFQTNIKDEGEWLTLWDQYMRGVIEADDMEGYTNLLLCGEEDYGSKENNLDFFLKEKRKRKVKLAFLRLLCNVELADANREFLEMYLKAHTMGAESIETWLVLKEDYPNRKEYIDLFLQLGCLTEDNFDAILQDLGADEAELKTYVLRYKEEHMKSQDFFDTLSLDL